MRQINDDLYLLFDPLRSGNFQNKICEKIFYIFIFILLSKLIGIFPK